MGEHNLPPLVEIGLIYLPKPGWAVHPAPSLYLLDAHMEMISIAPHILQFLYNSISFNCALNFTTQIEIKGTMSQQLGQQDDEHETCVIVTKSIGAKGNIFLRADEL